MAQFRNSMRAHFDDCDPAGVLFFANYYKLAHRNLESFFESAEIAHEEWFANPEFMVPLIHCEADYRSSIFAGQEMTLSCGIKKMGSRSITFWHRFEDKHGSVSADLETVHVFVSSKTKKATKIPESLRERLERLSGLSD